MRKETYFLNNKNTIITSNLNDEFKQLRNSSINRNYANMQFDKSRIIHAEDLPKNIRTKMKRTANYSGNGGFANGVTGANIKMGNPTFYHPLFQPVNMMLPRDRRERYEWCRHFYRTEPIIATAIDLHTEYPISDFNNQCSDESIKKFFDYMVFDKLDIINLLLNIGHEYWKLGDVFPFGQLDEDAGMWEKFTILNPDFINIQSSVFADNAIIELVPDAQLTAIVNEGAKGENKALFRQLPEDVIRAVKQNRNIVLDSRLVSHIAHKAASYELWGTPLMMRCFKTLIYKDKLRGAQDAIANRHIFPVRLVKLGTPGEPYVTQSELENVRDMLIATDGDPSAFVIYHYGIQLDYVGSTGKILPLNTEFDFIQKELMNGLGINEALLNGQGPTYANAQVGMDALAKRYMSYRFKLESFIKSKIYKPIAEIQGFYKPKNGEVATAHLQDKEIRKLAAKNRMDLVIPDIRWQQQDLTSNQSAVQLLNALQGKGLVSTETVQTIIGLDPETERKNLTKERGTVFDPNAPKTGPELNSSSSSPIASPPISAPARPADNTSEEAANTKGMKKLADFFDQRATTEESSPVIIQKNITQSSGGKK